MTLYTQIKQRMLLFGLHNPFTIQMIDIDSNGEPQRDEYIKMLNNHVTFGVTVENSIPTLNELVAKAKIGIDHGELMCTQMFNSSATKEQKATFFNTISPLINSFAFSNMKQYLSHKDISKEVMEWKFFLEALLEIDKPDHETKMSILSLYVALVSNRLIEPNLPKVLQLYREPVNVLLSLANQPPSPELLCLASNQIIGKTMRVSIAENTSGSQLFNLQYCA